MGHFLLFTIEHFFILIFKNSPEAICGRTSPMLSQQMALLSREIGDLLRQSRTCSIPASKFIPSYHHHFGRQCRVADYGYTKLAELFEALPHVLQVCMGMYAYVAAAHCCSSFFLCVGVCQFLCVHFCIFFSKFQISPVTKSDHFLYGKSAVTGHLAWPVGALFAEFCQDSVFH